MIISKIDKSYAVEQCYGNFYGGGDIVWSMDGQHLYCLNGSEINQVNVLTSEVQRKCALNPAAEENWKANDMDDALDDPIYSFDLAVNNEYIITAHRSSLLRLWHLFSDKVEKLWKSQHKGPLNKVIFSMDSRLVCSSGSDSNLRIWDYNNSHLLCVLKEFAGPAQLVKFHPCPSKQQIFATGSDHSIYCWDYNTKELLLHLRGHLSQITALIFANNTAECKFVTSVSRDKVLIVWNLTDGSQFKVIPIYEELEGAFYVTAEQVIAASGQGNLHRVHISTGQVYNLRKTTTDSGEITQLLYNSNSSQLAIVTAEHNILVYSLDKQMNNLQSVKQLIGFNDEILDICLLGENEHHLAMATNSKNIKLYDLENNMNCNIISGHTDIVMSLTTTTANRNLVLSAGKDFNIFLWLLDSANCNLKCLAKHLNAHTSTIGCISFSFGLEEAFASVCQSGSLKVWSLKKKGKSQEVVDGYRFDVTYAVVAHTKEVNCVCYSPNNKFIATASQDKTAKVWSAEREAALGTLRGHKRGVWSVRFSPVDQVLLTTSTDCTLCLWSLRDLSCLKRFEQTASILRGEFMDNGKLILTAGADGLLKVWSIKTNTCIQTLEKHEGRIWSLAVSQRCRLFFYSGAADSKLIKWRDISEQTKKAEIEKQQQLTEQEQILQNLLNENVHLEKALMLALKLEKPKTSYRIFQQYVRQRKLETIKYVINNLDVEQRRSLFDHVKNWSTNSRYSHIANIILTYLLNGLLVEPSETQLRSYNAHHLVEVLTPYVQRHFKRLTEVKKDLNFLEFIVENI